MKQLWIIFYQIKLEPYLVRFIFSSAFKSVWHFTHSHLGTTQNTGCVATLQSAVVFVSLLRGKCDAASACRQCLRCVCRRCQIDNRVVPFTNNWHALGIPAVLQQGWRKNSCPSMAKWNHPQQRSGIKKRSASHQCHFLIHQRPRLQLLGCYLLSLQQHPSLPVFLCPADPAGEKKILDAHHSRPGRTPIYFWQKELLQAFVSKANIWRVWWVGLWWYWCRITRANKLVQG